MTMIMGYLLYIIMVMLKCVGNVQKILSEIMSFISKTSKQQIKLAALWTFSLVMSSDYLSVFYIVPSAGK